MEKRIKVIHYQFFLRILPKRFYANMLVFSNKVSDLSNYEKNISHIKSKEYLLWLQEMYETCIEKEQDEEKIEIILKMRDAIIIKIQEIERRHRFTNAFNY